MGRGKRKRWGNGRGGGQRGEQKRIRDDSTGYEPIVLKSEAFEKYYQAQKLVPGGNTPCAYSPTGARYGAVALVPTEWDRLLEAARKPLPTSFRVTGTRSSAVEFRNMIETRFFSKMQELQIEGVDIAPPSPIAFYPDRLAWQMHVNRGALRKAPAFNDFHRFLVAMNEKGNLSRQEAVSMIPPLLLDVQPEHAVLDMCAAPGSKTAQLIEMLHSGDAPPTGIVIANDVENKRCYTLTHQTKRLQSPNFVVTNLDASKFPSLRVPSSEPGRLDRLQFDRVLCDVPCSGDGTLRKNQAVWKKWNPMNGVGLHKMQIKIAFRGAQLLKVGGRLVYSTCSFNPIENEAVVAALLRTTSLELIDVSADLPDLKRHPGLSTWKVIEKYGEELPSRATTRPELRKQFVPSLWPPTPEEAEWMHLERCVRVYPQQQNTGGFFICAFRKKAPMSSREGREEAAQQAAAATAAAAAQSSGDAPDAAVGEGAASSAAASTMDEDVSKSEPAPSDAPAAAAPPRKASQSGYKEDPYIFLETDGDKYWPPIKEFYGFSDAFPARNIFTRSEGDVKRHIYFVSDMVRHVIQNNELSNVRIINAGVKVLTRSDARNKPCDYRLCMDGLQSTWQWLEKRVAPCTMNDLGKVIRQDGAEMKELSELVQDGLKDVSIGCTVLRYDPAADPNGSLACALQVLVWRSDDGVRTLVSKDDRKFFCSLLGIPVEEDTRKRALEQPCAAEAESEAPAEVESASKRLREDTESEAASAAPMATDPPT